MYSQGRRQQVLGPPHEPADGVGHHVQEGPAAEAGEAEEAKRRAGRGARAADGFRHSLFWGLLRVPVSKRQK